MGATFSRLKNWVAEVLSYADLNAEIDNILTNLTPAGIDDMSATQAAFRLQTDPGEVGSESLPASLEQEIKRLRFVLQEIKGGDVSYWYESSSVSLSSLRTAIGGTLQGNRIVSGAASSLSSAARFLVPAGSSASFTLDGSPTSFVYVISNTQYSVSTDITTTSLGTAPASNNTATVNDATLVAQESSSWQGEEGTTITVDAMGTEITALVGKMASFKVVHGGNTEYFVAYVKSTTQLTNAYRGYFYDSTKAQIPRIAIADNDTITLMRTAWVFANTSSTVELTYNNPVFSYTQPVSASSGDYWYDMSVNYWKKFDSITWNTANSLLVGLICLDSSNAKGARSFEYFAVADTASNLNLEYVSATQIANRDFFGKIGVGSNSIKFKFTKPTWDITTDLESGFSEAASTTYYAYVTEAGKRVLSPNKPFDFSGTDQGGYYHPYEIWRYVGKIENNASQDFNTDTLVTGSPTFPVMPTGLKPLRNYVYNAEFRFFQRQTPGTLTTYNDATMAMDRWYLLTSTTTNVQCARVAETITASPTPYVAQIRQNDGTVRRFGLAQILPNDRSSALTGKRVTLSFWARTDTTEVTAIRAGVVEWTGTADAPTRDLVSAWNSTPTLVASAAFANTPGDLALTSSWAQYSITCDLSTSHTNLYVFIWSSATEAQNDDFYVTQVQLVEGNYAMPWNYIRKTFSEDLDECQRFYNKSYSYDTAPAAVTESGAHVWQCNVSTSDVGTSIKYPTMFKSSPTFAYWDLAGNPSKASYYSFGAFAQNNNVNAITVVNAAAAATTVYYSTTAGTAGNAAIHWTISSEF